MPMAVVQASGTVATWNGDPAIASCALPGNGQRTTDKCKSQQAAEPTTRVVHPYKLISHKGSLHSAVESKSWVLSFGGTAVILEPESLRNAVAAVLEELLKEYEGRLPEHVLTDRSKQAVGLGALGPVKEKDVEILELAFTPIWDCYIRVGDGGSEPLETISLTESAGEDGMRHASFVSALLFALAPICRADIMLTFTGLTDGESLTTYSTQGFQISDPTGFNVIGPGNPYYTGATGLNPTGNDWYITMTNGSSWTLTDLKFSLGLLGTPGQIDLTTFGSLGGVGEYSILTDTSLGFDTNNPQAPIPPVDELRVSMNNSIPPYQVTEIGLGIAGAVQCVAVPEPSTLLTVVLGAALWLGYACWRQTTGAPTAST